VVLGPDPYAALGVPRDATDGQIAEARRRLSREYHPDRNGTPNAAARFIEVQQAFDLLSDPAARAEYDRTSGQRDVVPPVARDQGLGTEVAPGIFIHPAAVDFGRIPSLPFAGTFLRLGLSDPPFGPVATVTVSWTGASPDRVSGWSGSEWCKILRWERTDQSCGVFFLCARAVFQTPVGRLAAKFTVTLDDTSIAVPITAEFRTKAPRIRRAER
jgi:DnaJ-like protein